MFSRKLSAAPWSEYYFGELAGAEICHELPQSYSKRREPRRCHARYASKKRRILTRRHSSWNERSRTVTSSILSLDEQCRGATPDDDRRRGQAAWLAHRQWRALIPPVPGTTPAVERRCRAQDEAAALRPVGLFYRECRKSDFQDRAAEHGVEGLRRHRSGDLDASLGSARHFRRRGDQVGQQQGVSVHARSRAGRRAFGGTAAAPGFGLAAASAGYRHRPHGGTGAARRPQRRAPADDSGRAGSARPGWRSGMAGSRSSVSRTASIWSTSVL